LIEFRDRLKAKGLLGKLTFTSSGRVDMIDDEMCKILKELNILSLAFGFESNSTRVLRYIKNKSDLTAEKNEEAIKLCTKWGIDASGSLMLGMPTEKISDMKKSIEFIDFARKHGASRIGFNVLVPYPGTEIWNIAKERGKVKDEGLDWASIFWYNEDNPRLLDDDVPKEEFVKMYKLAKKKCRYFVYRIFLKTVLKNPGNLLRFFSWKYVKRFIGFVEQ